MMSALLLILYVVVIGASYKGIIFTLEIFFSLIKTCNKHLNLKEI